MTISTSDRDRARAWALIGMLLALALLMLGSTWMGPRATPPVVVFLKHTGSPSDALPAWSTHWTEAFAPVQVSVVSDDDDEPEPIDTTGVHVSCGTSRHDPADKQPFLELDYLPTWLLDVELPVDDPELADALHDYVDHGADSFELDAAITLAEGLRRHDLRVERMSAEDRFDALVLALEEVRISDAELSLAMQRAEQRSYRTLESHPPALTDTRIQVAEWALDAARTPREEDIARVYLADALRHDDRSPVARDEALAVLEQTDDLAIATSALEMMNYSGPYIPGDATDLDRVGARWPELSLPIGVFQLEAANIEGDPAAVQRAMDRAQSTDRCEEEGRPPFNCIRRQAAFRMAFWNDLAEPQTWAGAVVCQVPEAEVLHWDGRAWRSTVQGGVFQDCASETPPELAPPPDRERTRVWRF